MKLNVFFLALLCAQMLGFGQAQTGTNETTFLFFADTQIDEPLYENDKWKMMQEFVKKINALNTRKWPDSIRFHSWQIEPTHFSNQDSITPSFMVMGGDLTQYGGTGRQLTNFKYFFDQNYSKGSSINLPMYIGLGNHDLNHIDKKWGWGEDAYNKQMIAYLEKKNDSAQGEVPADNFDKTSGSYSWNAGGVHFVQLNRFGGDNVNNMRQDDQTRPFDYYLTANFQEPNNSLQWLRDDLQNHQDKPVIIFQHYGWDNFGSQMQIDTTNTENKYYAWWTPSEINALNDVLNNHPRRVLRFHGHSHVGDESLISPTMKTPFTYNPGAASPVHGTDDKMMFYAVRIIQNHAEILLLRFDGTDLNSELEMVYSFREDIGGNQMGINNFSPVPIPTNTSSCKCQAKEFYKTNEASYVKFNLPVGNKDQTIRVKNGAYNRYMWAKCNRVLWKDMIFTCKEDSVGSSTGTWTITKGEYWTDNGCGTWSPQLGPIVYSGNKTN